MLGRLVHRGPDEQGIHHESGVGLGIRRLRVIDPEGGRQPVSNENGTVRAVMNGEIYNYRELRHDLIQKGHRFASESDTEVLVHLYEEEGAASVQKLRGMFAYALWDREKSLLILARDRFGIKPLYYTRGHSHDGASPLLFSSELPSLLAACPAAGLRPQAVLDYLHLLYVPGPDTIYEGICQVRSGEILSVRNGRIESSIYWHPHPTGSVHRWTTREEGIEHLLAQLRDSVRAHLVSDVPLGLFLSGGIDSSAILACMRQEVTGSIKTFSIGYDDPADASYNELPAARRAATHFHTDHTEERVNPDVAALLPRIVAGMAEPFGDSCAIPTYLISEVARRTVTVALSGIGGDELFGGYPRYLGARLAGWYNRTPQTLRKFAAHSVARRIPEGSGGRDHAGRMRRFLADGELPLAEQYVRWTTFIPQEWGKNAFSCEFLKSCGMVAPTTRRERLFDEWPVNGPASRAAGVDLQTYLPDDLLRMGDRMSMVHSLELRVPYCDHVLLGFAQSIPESLRLSRWRLKGFFRDALKGILPGFVLAAPKYGFRIPLARWLRQDLRPLVYDLLNDSTIRRRGYMQPEYVQWLLREHDRGSRNFADQIYALVILELWHRRHPAAGHAMEGNRES
jgi:asparagine synthase (glutamine-hydrolysing)